MNAGFDCLLTRDQPINYLENRPRATLKKFPAFAVVIVELPQKPWLEYREQFVSEWTDRAIDCRRPTHALAGNAGQMTGSSAPRLYFDLPSFR